VKEGDSVGVIEREDESVRVWKEDPENVGLFVMVNEIDE
jgi:hypothetical protein